MRVPGFQPITRRQFNSKARKWFVTRRDLDYTALSVGQSRYDVIWRGSQPAVVLYEIPAAKSL